MLRIIKQLISLLLPITVLIIVPLFIEKDLSLKHIESAIPGLILIITGLSVVIITISAIIRIGKGTLAPWSPTKKLVTSGLYRFVRNPMITGVLLTLTGETISTMSFNLFLWTLIFFIANNIFFLLYEEPNLIKRFGDGYLDYKRSVPRWLPRLKPFESNINKK